ncbi:MAG TPA: hypothetical protein PLE60_00655 [Candidatus Latescibacteria bacterium]|nr:hypothetical protein [Candidatus Latescibacterota bacterium]
MNPENSQLVIGFERMRRILSLLVPVLFGVSKAPAGLGPLDLLVDGFCGVRTSPPSELWVPEEPTSLLGRHRFVVSLSTVLGRSVSPDYVNGVTGESYAAGLGEGATMGWDYGVTGVWALGAGQSLRWVSSDRFYRVSPSPKIGAMALSHAWERGSWSIGGTAKRHSFSLTDDFQFVRFPRSSNVQINNFLYNHLETAIGRTISYDALGNNVIFVGDARWKTPFGTFGVMLSAHDASLDAVTEHRNTIVDTLYSRHLLNGVKNGDLNGTWSGIGATLAWDGRVRPDLSFGLRCGRSETSGDAVMWIRNPSEFPDGHGYTYKLEPRVWGLDTLSFKNRHFSLRTSFNPAVSTEIECLFSWQGGSVENGAFGQTPVLTIDAVGDTVLPISQGAFATVQGSFEGISILATVRHSPGSQPWSFEGSIGYVRVSAHADFSAIPRATGFDLSSRATTWDLNAARLGYCALGFTRRVTSQFYLTYSVRHLFPLSMDWRRNGARDPAPGGLTGFRFGSLHEMSASMVL